MSVDDFRIPPLLRDFQADWQPPTLVGGHEDLLISLDLASPDALTEQLTNLLDALEPTLILLALCGYATERLVITRATPPAVSLRFDTMQATADSLPELTNGLTGTATVIGLALATQSTRPVRLTRLTDGWLPIELPTTASTLNLQDVVDNLPATRSAVETALLDDVDAAVGEHTLTELATDPDLHCGFLGLFDPNAWFVPGLADPAGNAYAAGDPDAMALVFLGEQMRSQVDRRTADFLREELASWVPLRQQLNGGREDRQILRRGMRGARRRHHAIDQDGLRRAFRLGRARRLTYTGFLLGCHVEEVADVLHGLALAVPPGEGPEVPVEPEGDESPPQEPVEEPVEEPEEPEPPPELTGPGALHLRVVDDAGNPLPLAWVSITGAASHSLKTGDDGAVVLDNQAPGLYTAANTGYPGCGDGTVDFELVHETTVEVELVVPRLPPNPDLPPLRGGIAEASGFFVRESPGDTGPKLGKLHYRAFEVTVLEAREALSDGNLILWYRVRFTPSDLHAVVAAYENELYNQGDLEELGRLLAAVEARQGTEAWVGADGLAMVAMPWDHFLLRLVRFELDHAHEDILVRLSRLRQMGENPDVPGNAAAGLDQVGIEVENGQNITERTYLPNEWSLLLEAKQVELPDGEVVDIHHFLLGVEGLIDDGRRSNARTVLGWPLSLPEPPDTLKYRLHIGESYSALTWSGDVGAAVSDMVRHESDDWEDAHTGLPHPDVVEFYFRSRVPDLDLLADIDAWGAYDLVPYLPNHLANSPQPSPSWQPTPPVATLEQLVTEVYGPSGPLSSSHITLRNKYRAEGIRRLLNHYGFTAATGLQSQTAAIRLMRVQAQTFATEAWFTVKAVKAASPTDLSTWEAPEPSTAERIAMRDRTNEMVPLFLDELRLLIGPLGVTLP